ncbi:uncharacterized protein HMPREF1541_02909 [Cyphellophora europaea CBS 101466]|uniref:Amidase domain-containing protein n=1 Tax=Cyphellophora europaea (strain CBS 101466) TaxID=1220924 RepID=W2S565_CYPE1|nr:uncharacterized protein HMPREF1541_02909 [Cyphellophora europaea CBS 101466]ETN43750.1 hypothetical protein HMPREF1541_02909 [Cyphellophora europaea CBS 101466]
MIQHVASPIQVKGIPQGSPEYEQKRADLLRTFYDKIPAQYYLPRSLIEHPPLDVSGIPRTAGILTSEEVEITETYDAVGLAEAIAAKKYTSVAVASAFCKRAIVAHQLTCCLTQWFMDEAIEQAKQLDEYLAVNGRTIGPLHGVPISIKDHMPIAGTYSSMGCFGSIVKDETDSHMIKILRNLGAVFYVKTNQPQTIMHLESDSHWGRVLNPYNINLSAGGSTGGEAALIALQGSVLGVGTDIGGSIRGPSAFCGIYGFKPTSYTLPMKDFLPGGFPAEINILCSTGPMCRSLRDMELFMSTVLAAKPYLSDPRIIPIPWTGLQTPTKKLKIGIMNDDGFIRPQPPVQRAMAWAQSILSQEQYSSLFELKTYKPYDAQGAWARIRKMYWPDAANGPKEAITSTGEPILPLSRWIWKDAELEGEKTGTEVSKMRVDRDEFRCNFAEGWMSQDVDVVLAPAYVGPACAHDTAFYWTYTSLWNFVDYPAAVFPTPITAKADEQYSEGYTPLSEACSHVKQLWEETSFVGAPIDLQLVAKKYHDNELFGALQVLKDVLSLS